MIPHSGEERTAAGRRFGERVVAGGGLLFTPRRLEDRTDRGMFGMTALRGGQLREQESSSNPTAPKAKTERALEEVG